MLQRLLQAFERIVMQPYWRLIRGQTLGVQGIVIRSGTEVLLVRQSYAPGWQFPGGGVDRSEHLADALERREKRGRCEKRRWPAKGQDRGRCRPIEG